MSDDHADDREPSDDDHQAHEDDHDHHAADLDTVGVGIVTVSSSRTLDEDPAGDTIATTFEAAGHEVSMRDLVADSYDNVQGAIDNLADRSDTDVVVTTGGTGVTPDDVTIEAAAPLFEKDLPGFGELFRQRSYEEIGSMVIATRATAGIVGDVPVFCLPGSESAAALGAGLATEVCAHLAGLAERDEEIH
jgi:molybdopterin adenylyltransferase